MIYDEPSDVISDTGTASTQIDTVQSSVSWTLGANLEFRAGTHEAAASESAGEPLRREFNPGVPVLHALSRWRGFRSKFGSSPAALTIDWGGAVGALNKGVPRWEQRWSLEQSSRS